VAMLGYRLGPAPRSMSLGKIEEMRRLAVFRGFAVLPEAG
jgi:hypothetical protein